MIEELSRSLLQVSIKEGHSVHAQDVVLATATPIHHNLTCLLNNSLHRLFLRPNRSRLHCWMRNH